MPLMAAAVVEMPNAINAAYQLRPHAISGISNTAQSGCVKACTRSSTFQRKP
jgi:hypothetical protein